MKEGIQQQSKIVDEKEYKNVGKKIWKLQNINIKIKKGEFVSIVGKTGAGKTSLIKSILDALHTVTGRVEKNGTIGYIP